MIDYCPSRNLPWDDEPDPIEEAKRFIKAKEKQAQTDQDLAWAIMCIKTLLHCIDEQ